MLLREEGWSASSIQTLMHALLSNGRPRWMRMPLPGSVSTTALSGVQRRLAQEVVSGGAASLGWVWTGPRRSSCQPKQKQKLSMGEMYK